MKKLLPLLLLAGCTHKIAPVSEAVPPSIILQDEKLVPSLCSEVVALVVPDSDGLVSSQSLEEKAYRLTRSDAQHRANTAKLEAAAIRCGVKVTRP